MSTSLVYRRDSSSRLRIVVLGYLVRGPMGGMAWHYLQYVLGLHQLGHDVLFVEDSGDHPECYDPSKHQMGTDPTYGLGFADQAFRRLQLPDAWAYYDAHRSTWQGPAAGRAVEFCREADILLNVSGVNPLRSWLLGIPVRTFIDTDPGFTQIRHLSDGDSRQLAARHNAFFSFGELIQSGKSHVPDDGFRWQATRQPVVIDAWPVTASPQSGGFTTVMQWDSYPPVQYAAQQFGMKSHSFAECRDLPQRVSASMEIALGSPHAPRGELRKAGWKVVDPLEVTRDPWTYQAYLQQSCGEFSVAKHGYVAGRTGWFSERSACYLASSRPVVVQDTGFSHLYPCGRGLLAFTDTESAVEAIRQVQADHATHCRAAREIAAECFNARAVLDQLLEQAVNSADEVIT